MRVGEQETTVRHAGLGLRRAAALAAMMSSIVCCGLGIARADDSWPGPTVLAKAPKDIKVGVVACGAQFRGCYAPALAAAEAAKALGWTVTIYDGAGTQEKQTAECSTPFLGSVILLTAALGPDLIQLGLSKAKEAGVPVVSSSAGTDTPNPVITPPNGGLKYVTDVGTDFPAAGRGLGDFAVKESGGKANVVVYEDDEYPSSVASLRGSWTSSSNVPAARLSDIVKMTASQVGSVGQMVVDTFQAHPDVDWV